MSKKEELATAIATAKADGEKFVRPHLSINEKGIGEVGVDAYTDVLKDSGVDLETAEKVNRAQKRYVTAVVAESHWQSETFFAKNKDVGSTVVTANMGQDMRAAVSHTAKRVLPGGVETTNSGVAKVTIGGKEGGDVIKDLLKGLTTPKADPK